MNYRLNHSSMYLFQTYDPIVTELPENSKKGELHVSADDFSLLHYYHMLFTDLFDIQWWMRSM